MRAQEILPGLYQLTGGGTNLFVVVEEELTLIDTGLPGSHTGIINFLQRVGRKPEEIGSIIITHNHIDHIGSVPDLRRFTNARIFIHQAAMSSPDIDPPYPHGIRRLLRVPFLQPVRKRFVLEPENVDVQLEGNEVLSPLGGLKVVHSPGHTPGSICLYAEKLKLIFIGDSMQRRRYRLQLPARRVSTDLDAALDSIRKIADLSPDIICFGHGKPLFTGARKMLLSLIERSGG